MTGVPAWPSAKSYPKETTVFAIGLEDDIDGKMRPEELGDLLRDRLVDSYHRLEGPG